jgi:hypothetical protein
VVHTLRILIQLNCVVLAYNFNLVIGANNLNVKYMCNFCLQPHYSFTLLLYLTYQLIPVLAEYQS